MQETPLAPNVARKIPIGVFDPAFPDWPLDEMIDKFAVWGIEAVEIGTAIESAVSFGSAVHDEIGYHKNSQQSFTGFTRKSKSTTVL